MDSQRADGAGGQQIARATRDLTPHVISIMTTEHYTLQTGRVMTISDANGRASLFLGTVSTSLVALAFVGGLPRSGAGVAFYIFGLVLFPSLAFLGLVTFERVRQSGIEDLLYARGINRIRHLYQEHAPEMRPYFVLSAHDDDAGVMGNAAMRPGVWQIFLSTAGMIAVIKSVIVGAFQRAAQRAPGCPPTWRSHRCRGRSLPGQRVPAPALPVAARATQPGGTECALSFRRGGLRRRRVISLETGAQLPWQARSLARP